MLGIGSTAIAYNFEPGSASDSRTRVVQLTPESVSRRQAILAGRPCRTVR